MLQTIDDLEGLLAFSDDEVSTGRSKLLQSTTSATTLNLESTSPVASCSNNEDLL